MKIKTFVIGCSLALAVFVFGQRRPDTTLHATPPVPPVFQQAASYKANPVDRPATTAPKSRLHRKSVRPAN